MRATIGKKAVASLDSNSRGQAFDSGSEPRQIYARDAQGTSHPPPLPNLY